MYKSNRTTVPVTLTLLLLLQSAASEGQGNQVTVKKRGGDYSDPIAAANNAYQGDAWCVSPQLPKDPCVIKILPGIYVLPETLVVPAGVALVGRGKHEVLLLAGKGLLVAVASTGPLVAELSIVNDEPEGVALVFGGELKRVALQAHSVGLTNDAWGFRLLDTHLDIADSDISAGASAVRIDATGFIQAFRARHSRIIGGTRAINMDISSGVFLRNCEVAARGSSSTSGIMAIEIDETQLDVEIFGGSLSAENTGEPDSTGLTIGAIALDLHDFIGNLLMVGTRVHAGGAWPGVGVKLDRDDFGFDTFDGVSIKSSSAAIVRVEAGGDTSVLRSHIDAPVALDLRVEFAAFSQPVEINQSFVKGDLTLAENPTQITSSVLTGSLSGDDITCRNVYDADYVLHSNDCPVN